MWMKRGMNLLPMWVGVGAEGMEGGRAIVIVKVVFASVLITKYLFVDNFDMPGASLSI